MRRSGALLARQTPQEGIQAVDALESQNGKEASSDRDAADASAPEAASSTDASEDGATSDESPSEPLTAWQEERGAVLSSAAPLLRRRPSR